MKLRICYRLCLNATIQSPYRNVASQMRDTGEECVRVRRSQLEHNIVSVVVNFDRWKKKLPAY